MDNKIAGFLVMQQDQQKKTRSFESVVEERTDSLEDKV